ncbi:MAG: hypothetical protein ACI93T_002606 [Porticoccaceae bacterium]|jgi:hypothetical protein
MSGMALVTGALLPETCSVIPAASAVPLTKMVPLDWLPVLTLEAQA